MQLEEYFEFEPNGQIRLKGHRIWVQHVLHEHLHNARSAEEIVNDCFPSLSLDKVYATILYYHRNRERLNQYLADWIEGDRKAHEEYLQANPERTQRLRHAKEQRGKAAS
jgi:uncharacterized protein (DUF433 family)